MFYKYTQNTLKKFLENAYDNIINNINEKLLSIEKNTMCIDMD